MSARGEVATVTGRTPFDDDVSVRVRKGRVATVRGMSSLDLVDVAVRIDYRVGAIDAAGWVSTRGDLDLLTF